MRREIKLNLSEHEAYKLRLAVCGSLNKIEEIDGTFGEKSEKGSQDYATYMNMFENIREAEKAAEKNGADRYDNQISLAVTINSKRKDLSDVSREQVLHTFTTQINDLFDHGEFHEAITLEDQIENTTYTIWFQQSDERRSKVWISESEMRAEADRYGFDAEEVINNGEIFFWNEGVEPYDNPRSDSDDICGGCYKVEGGAA